MDAFREITFSVSVYPRRAASLPSMHWVKVMGEVIAEGQRY